MDDSHSRLVHCFTAVFPDLTPAEVAAATPLNVAAWDSIAHVTLLAVVEEEFDTEIPVDNMEELGSFALLLAYLERESSST